MPRQRQDLDAVRVLRPADRVGAAGLPGDAVPEDDAGVGRGELKVTNVKEANQYVRRTYRKGWEVEGL